MRYPHFLAILSALLYSLTTSAQINASQSEHTVTQFRQYFNDNKSDSAFNMLSPGTKLSLTAEKLQGVFTQMRAQFGNLDSTRILSVRDSVSYFKANFSKISLLLTISLNAEQKIGVLNFTPYSEPVKPLSNSKLEESDISFKRPDLMLKGILSMPKSDNKKKLILIVPGSGPTDRNGNQPGVINNSLQLVSRGLTEQGFVTVRYDKRRVGESIGAGVNTGSLRFNDYINDLISVVQDLKNDKRFEQIILLGHSEGALLAMIVAAKLKPAGLIILNGQAERADILLRRQLRQNLPDSTFRIADKIINSLKDGKTVDGISDNTLLGIFLPEVQPYLRSWMAYDPTLIISQILTPPLIIQGLADLQTGAEQAQALSKAQPSSKLVLINGMNHVLKKSSTNRIENLQTYNNPNLELHEMIVPTIVSFIEKIK